jgi:hypothetical protein
MQPLQYPHDGSSLTDFLPCSIAVVIFEFLDRQDLLSCMLLCKATLRRITANDHLWLPIARRLLSERLCLLPEVHQAVRSAQHHTRVCMAALKAAFADAKRCVLRKDELCAVTFNLSYHMFADLRAHNVMDADLLATPSYKGMHFDADDVLRSAPGATESSVVNLDWFLALPEHGLLPVLDAEGVPRFLAPNPSMLPPPEFSVVHCATRPPLRVYRHPTNWGIVLVNYRVIMATFETSPPTDMFTAALPAYVHSWNFGGELRTLTGELYDEGGDTSEGQTSDGEVGLA